MFERCFLAFIALGVAACTPSLQPVYTKEQLIHDPRVEGVWQDTTDGTFYIFERDRKDGYTLTYHRFDEHLIYTAHLARARNLTFVDLASPDTTSSWSSPDGVNFPVHSFALLDFDSARAVIRQFDPESLATFIRGPEGRVSYLPTDSVEVLLTASANDIQEMLSRYIARNGKVESTFLLKLPENLACSAVSSATYDVAPRGGGVAGGNMSEAGISLRSVGESGVEVTVSANSSQLKSHLPRFLEVEGLYVKQEERRTLNADSSFLAVTDPRTGFRFEVRWNGITSRGEQRIQVAVCPERFASASTATAAVPVPGTLIKDPANPDKWPNYGMLTWNSVPGATAYEIHSESYCFSGLPHCWQRWVVPDTSFQTEHRRPHTWRVRALFGNAGFGRLSPIRKVDWPTR